MKQRKQTMFLALACAVIALALPAAQAQDTPNPDSQDLPNMAQQITPLAPPGSRFEPMNPDLTANPSWLAGQAVTTVASPDGKTLLVLCSGFNIVFTGSLTSRITSQFVFIYDISAKQPVKKQVVQIPNTYNGIVFDPSGTHFYVAGGSDDNIHTVTLGSNGEWAEEQPTSPALTMGHAAGNGLSVQPGGTGPVNAQVGVKPCAAGLAISKDGKTLVVANYYNDSITVFSGGYGNWSKGTELDLRPGKSNPAQAGVPGGEYAFWVAVKGSAARRHGLHIQHSRPRDRCREPQRNACGYGPHRSERSTQQDDPERGAVAALCRRRRNGYRRCNLDRQQRHPGDHSGHRSAGRVAHCPRAIYRRKLR